MHYSCVNTGQLLNPVNPIISFVLESSDSICLFMILHKNPGIQLQQLANSEAQYPQLYAVCFTNTK